MPTNESNEPRSVSIAGAAADAVGAIFESRWLNLRVRVFLSPILMSWLPLPIFIVIRPLYNRNEFNSMFYLLLLLLAFAAAAETHEIYPDRHSRVFSAHEKPVLHIRSGDTVITKTWDSGGQD